MNKITKVKIENFRNIKSLEFEVGDTLVISGPNGVGKSNCINALVWFFTDSIYTDNLGVGENDINSIVPRDQEKGDKVAVEVTFTSGAILRKEYITGYERLTGKANKHTTKGYVNGVEAKNTTEWFNTLYEIVGFENAFKGVDEVKLYIDPLYALQKLDSKCLRQFLVSIGCSVTNEELFKLGFEDLKPYEGKYLGNYVNMRTDLKKMLKNINEALEKNQILRDQFNEVQEFDNSKIDEINKQLDELNEKKAKLKVGGSTELLKQKEEELKDLISKKDKEIHDYKHNLELIRQQFENELLMLNQNIKHENALKSDKVRSKVESDKLSLQALETQQNAKQGEKTALRKQLETIQMTAKSYKEKKAEMQSRLLDTKSKEFTGFVKCPECGTEFAPDNEALEKFETQKNNDIKFYTKQIADFNLKLENLITEVNEIRVKASNIDKEANDIQASIELKKIELEADQKELKQVESETEITNHEHDAEIAEWHKKIDDVDNKLNNFTPVQANPEVIDLQAEVDELYSRSKFELESALEPINLKVKELETNREALYIERADWNAKVKYTEVYNETIKQLNDAEALLGRVDAFIHKMIELINNKAKELTGVEFVMLEENLGNDGVKEVCYAVVNGVPFANINTAEKYTQGIRFIEKIKDIAVRDFNKQRNTLPILADKFEGIDSIEKIKSLTQEQLICSRVTDVEKMTFNN